MGKTKTKVKERTKKEVEKVTEDVKPEIPEQAQATEEEAQEFENKYTEQPAPKMNISEMETLASVYRQGLWKTFIAPNVFDADTRVIVKQNEIDVVSIDPAKISAGIIRNTGVTTTGGGTFDMAQDSVDRVVHFKASRMEFMGIGTPTAAVITGTIGTGETAKTVKVTMNLTEIGDAFLDPSGLEKTLERFSGEIERNYTVKTKELSKIVKEFAGGYSISSLAIFMVANGKLLLVEDGVMGIMVSELTETFSDEGIIGRYSTEYLKMLVTIVEKMGFDEVELRFMGKDKPLWIHAEDNGLVADLLLAPNIEAIDEDYYTAVVNALF